MANFFIAGTTKGGTSSLHLWLNQHPQIFLVPEKELHFFCRCPPHLKRAFTRGDYETFFTQADADIIGEASPCYMYYPEVARTLRAQFPGAKILMSLRDPVKRFWSHYLMNTWYRGAYASPEHILDSWPFETPPLATEDLVGASLYAAQVERFLNEFGSSRVQVIFLEELAGSPRAVLRSVLEFLEVEQLPLDTTEVDKVSVVPRNRVGEILLKSSLTRGVANAVLSRRARRFLKYRVLGRTGQAPEPSLELVEQLRALFRPDTQRLEELLGRPLPWDWHRGQDNGR